MRRGELIDLLDIADLTGSSIHCYTQKLIAASPSVESRNKSSKNIISQLDTTYCLDFLSRMARHKSHSQIEGDRLLAARMGEQTHDLGLDVELRPFDGERVNGPRSASLGRILVSNRLERVVGSRRDGIETGLDLEALIEAARLAESIVGHSLPGRMMKVGSLARFRSQISS